MGVLNKLSDIVNTLVEYVVAILMGLMTIVVFVQVIFRLAAGSLPWSEELARYMMIYLVYLGASVGVKYGNHIAVEFLSTMLPKKGQDILEVLVDLLMLLCFAVIIYYGFKVVNVTMMQKSPAMQLKMGYIYFSLVLGGGHSIGIPLAVSGRQTFIVPSASMTVHPVRMSGLMIAAPQSYRYFERVQESIVSFVARHSRITQDDFRQLMLADGDMSNDVGTILYGSQAVQLGLIDRLGTLSDALEALYGMIGKNG